MEQLVLLLIIAAISLVNWLIEKSAKLREQKRLEQLRRDREQSVGFPREAAQETVPQPAPPPPPTPSRTQEELRRMLESLGFPVEEPAAPPPLPRSGRIPEPEFEPVEAALFEEEPEPAAAPPPAPKPRTMLARTAAVHAPVHRNPWAEKLRTHEGFREAFALREIIGPPRCLEPHAP
jgi:hypothetical protein